MQTDGTHLRVSSTSMVGANFSTNTVEIERPLAEDVPLWPWKTAVRHLMKYVDLNLVDLCEHGEAVAALTVMQARDTLATRERRLQAAWVPRARIPQNSLPEQALVSFEFHGRIA